MDNTTGPKRLELEISGASWQETVCTSERVDATNLCSSVPSRDSESQSAKVGEENQDKHALTLLVSAGKRIALPREQVALQGIVRADLRLTKVRASSGLTLPAGTNQANVQKYHQQWGLPPIQINPHNGPAKEVIWKGNFEIPDCPYNVGHCEGITAHPSAKVSRKAYSFAKQIAGNLHFVMYAQTQFWQDLFGTHCPSRDDIALYFYPGNFERSRRQYSSLLKFIERMNLMLRRTWGGVELLVFPSKLLEMDSQKLDGSYFIWGVFHCVKGDKSTSNAGAQTSPMAVS